MQIMGTTRSTSSKQESIPDDDADSQPTPDSSGSARCPFMTTANSSISGKEPSRMIPFNPHQQIIMSTKRQFTEREISQHPLLPQRDGEDEKEFGGEITWRHGKKGDYTGANAKYLNERVGRWNSPDCLEHVVSNLIKTLEMELTKKSNSKQWVWCNVMRLVLSL